MSGALLPRREGRTAHPIVLSLTTISLKLVFSHITGEIPHTAHAEVIRQQLSKPSYTANYWTFNLEAGGGDSTEKDSGWISKVFSLGVRYTTRKQNNLEGGGKNFAMWRFRVWNAAFPTDSFSVLPSSMPETPMCSLWSDCAIKRGKKKLTLCTSIASNTSVSTNLLQHGLSISILWLFY